MWRYLYEDENFYETVQKLWKEIKPLYMMLHKYVKGKLKFHYKNIFKNNENEIPAHILGK